MTTAAATQALGHGETRQSIRLWTALSLATFLLSLVLWVGFMTAGGVFFVLSDAVALLMAATMIPVMVGYDRIFRPGFGTRSAVSRWVGVVGMTVAAVGSLVLLTAEVTHEYVAGIDGLGLQLIGFGLEGVWFLLVPGMARSAGIYDQRLVYACYATGVGFLMAVPGSVIGPDSLLVTAGGALSLVGFLLWALWSRRALQGGG